MTLCDRRPPDGAVYSARLRRTRLSKKIVIGYRFRLVEGIKKHIPGRGYFKVKDYHQNLIRRVRPVFSSLRAKMTIDKRIDPKPIFAGIGHRRKQKVLSTSIHSLTSFFGVNPVNGNRLESDPSREASAIINHTIARKIARFRSTAPIACLGPVGGQILIPWLPSDARSTTKSRATIRISTERSLIEIPSKLQNATMAIRRGGASFANSGIALA